MIERAASLGVDVPGILLADLSNWRIFLERIHGLTVKQFLYSTANDDSNMSIVEDLLARKIAISISKLHDAGVIHGDLTTSK